MPEQIQASDTRALLEKFFSLDDLQDLTSDAGTLLGCPILVVDDAFHVSSHFGPLGFSDTLFRTAVNNGEISYEAGAMLSRSEALTAGRADFFTLDGSPFRRRFSPLISAGVRLGEAAHGVRRLQMIRFAVQNLRRYIPSYRVRPDIAQVVPRQRLAERRLDSLFRFELSLGDICPCHHAFDELFHAHDG